MEEVATRNMPAARISVANVLPPTAILSTALFAMSATYAPPTNERNKQGINSTRKQMVLIVFIWVTPSYLGVGRGPYNYLQVSIYTHKCQVLSE